ncbi:hypothetical protein [Halorientalis salina]|uniref:hypothetical protein n=1 Tax=Halorientalis salina TaxID=2932266 RepID=UPI0010AD0FD9|nr:hypothetical protein [Halorientalis salina]
MIAENQPLPVRLVVRLVTAVVAVAVLEVVGIVLYLAVLKPSVLDTVLSGPDMFQIKLLLAGNGDVVLIAAALATIGLAFAFRSNSTGKAGSTADTAESVGTDSGPARASDGGGEADATGGFSFDEGE